MAFTTTITETSDFGNKKIVLGSWATDTTGGNIETTLSKVDFIHLTPNSTTIVADAPTVNETFPLASGDVTIIVTSGADGYFMAVGS